ncbi:MAG: enoyl-CoA hydratase/isomerase family protein, partial [Sandaracinus sp.]|nr:enoyl-CoA hydratase/isomerase family protein [Sandaracinus sp.]
MVVDVLRSSLTTLDAERVNAWRRELDRAPRVLVLEGAGEDFCAGLDLDAPEAVERAGEGIRALAAWLEALDRSSTIVIAAVRGRALGGGLGLVSVADVVLAAPDARFGLPEALVGLVPAVVLPYVARRMGIARARTLALTGATLDALEALRLGLVDEVHEDLERALAKVVSRVSRADEGAVAAIKGLVATHWSAPTGYVADAAERFDARLASPTTRRRLARFRDGLAPWVEDEESEADGITGD